MFSRVGEIVYRADKPGRRMLEAAIDAGADDVESDATGHSISAPFGNIGEVSAALAAQFGEAQSVKSCGSADHGAARPGTDREPDQTD